MILRLARRRGRAGPGLIAALFALGCGGGTGLDTSRDGSLRDASLDDGGTDGPSPEPSGGVCSWAVAIGPPGADVGPPGSLAPGARADSVLVAGGLSGVGSFEEGSRPIEPVGDLDLFIAHYVADGELEGVRLVRGGSLYAMQVVPVEGGSLLAASFVDRATLGPGESTEVTFESSGIQATRDVVVARYDDRGGLVWARIHRPLGWLSMHLAALPDGSFVASGAAEGAVMLDADGPTATRIDGAEGEGRRLYLAWFDAEGNVVAVRTLEQRGQLVGFPQPDGSLMVTGSFSQTWVLGEGEPTETTLVATNTVGWVRPDAFLARFESDGSLAWARSGGGGFPDEGQDVQSLADGSSLLTGRFRGPATFSGGAEPDRDLPPTGNEWLDDCQPVLACDEQPRRETFLARYDADGDLLWLRRAAGAEGELVKVLGSFLWPDGSVEVLAAHRGTLTLAEGDPEQVVRTAPPEEIDLVIATYDAGGRLSSARSVCTLEGDTTSNSEFHIDEFSVSMVTAARGADGSWGATAASRGDAVTFWIDDTPVSFDGPAFLLRTGPGH